jgi:hypothetical protein
MVLRSLRFLIIFLLIGTISNVAYAEEILITLDVPLYGQQTDMWCWAACGEMIMSHLGVNVSQCTQANNRFARNDCCTDFQNCVIGGWPEFEKYGFFYRGKSTPLTFVHLTAQMTNNKPVGFAWAWTAGGAHYMMIRGVYQDIAGGQFLHINDPSPWNANKANGGTAKLITYDEYISAWDHDLYWTDYGIVKN